MICEEFNLNSYSYIFDGESEPLDKLLSNYLSFQSDIEGKKNLFENFQMMSVEDFEIFRLNHSILANKLTLNPIGDGSESDYNLKFKNPKENIYKKDNDIEDVEINTLDSELNSDILFEEEKNPDDIS